VTAVWLSRRDCEEGTLPRMCLRCGRPTEELVEKDFAGTLLWSAPTSYLLAAVWGWESAKFRVPLCREHRHHWRARCLILLAGFVGLPASFGVFLLVWLAFTQGECFELLGWVLALLVHIVPSLLIVTVGYAMTGIHATEIHEDGIRLEGVSYDFLCACKAQLYQRADDIEGPLSKFRNDQPRRTDRNVTDEP
jgi:hypothetical protein